MRWLVLLCALQVSSTYSDCVEPKTSQSVFAASPPRQTIRGDLQWVYPTHAAVHTEVATDMQHVYAINTKNILYALHKKTGLLAWSRHIPQTKASQCASRVLEHNGKVIVVAAEGILYAFDTISGEALWGPLYLREEVCAAAVVCHDLLFIATAQSGLLWIIDPHNGKLGLQYPVLLHSPVRKNLLVEYNPLRWENQTDASEELFDFYVYACVPFKLLRVRISLKNQLSVRLDEVEFPVQDDKRSDTEISAASMMYVRDGPVVRKLLFVVMTKNLFAFDLVRNKVEWQVVLYPSHQLQHPLILGHTIVQHTQAYHLLTGRTQWHLWLDFEALSTAITHNNTLYIAGQHLKNSRMIAFLTAVYPHGGPYLWIDVHTPQITSLTMHAETLYITSIHGDVYAYG